MVAGNSVAGVPGGVYRPDHVLGHTQLAVPADPLGVPDSVLTRAFVGTWSSAHCSPFASG